MDRAADAATRCARSSTPRSPTRTRATIGRVLIVAGSRGQDRRRRTRGAGGAAIRRRTRHRRDAGVAACRSSRRSGAEYMTLAAAGGRRQAASAAARSIGLLASTPTSSRSGPGLGRSPASDRSCQALVERCGVPLVLDADAISMRSPASRTGWSAATASTSIITPHPGEMARADGHSRSKTCRRIGSTSRATSPPRTDVHVVLKGHRTIIASPEGRVFINLTGNPGMATGGTGDVLTGAIAAWMAQLLDAEAAPQRSPCTCTGSPAICRGDEGRGRHDRGRRRSTAWARPCSSSTARRADARPSRVTRRTRPRRKPRPIGARPRARGRARPGDVVLLDGRSAPARRRSCAGSPRGWAARRRRLEPDVHDRPGIPRRRDAPARRPLPADAGGSRRPRARRSDRGRSRRRRVARSLARAPPTASRVTIDVVGGRRRGTSSARTLLHRARRRANGVTSDTSSRPVTRMLKSTCCTPSRTVTGPHLSELTRACGLRAKRLGHQRVVVEQDPASPDIARCRGPGCRRGCAPRSRRPGYGAGPDRRRIRSGRRRPVFAQPREPPGVWPRSTARRRSPRAIGVIREDDDARRGRAAVALEHAGRGRPAGCRARRRARCGRVGVERATGAPVARAPRRE